MFRAPAGSDSATPQRETILIVQITPVEQPIGSTMREVFQMHADPSTYSKLVEDMKECMKKENNDTGSVRRGDPLTGEAEVYGAVLTERGDAPSLIRFETRLPRRFRGQDQPVVMPDDSVMNSIEQQDHSSASSLLSDGTRRDVSLGGKSTVSSGSARR